MYCCPPVGRPAVKAQLLVDLYPASAPDLDVVLLFLIILCCVSVSSLVAHPYMLCLGLDNSSALCYRQTCHSRTSPSPSPTSQPRPPSSSRASSPSATASSAAMTIPSALALSQASPPTFGSPKSDRGVYCTPLLLCFHTNRNRVPAGAAHIAFPAPSRDAVSAFFIAALKSGGKIHGEPCLRDADQNYYSAAVIDFDGNSIEAVHRPGISPSRPRAGGRALTAIENGSVVSRASKASSAKSRSLVQRHNSAPSEVSSIKAPSMHDFDSQSQSQSQSRGHGQSQNQNQRSKQTPPATQLPVPPKDNGLTGAKAVVGTLIGAAAGAAAAYAMFRTESQSEAPPKYSEAPSTQPQQAHDYRAIEQAPSDYGYARSSVSKNQKASTIFDGLEQASRILGGAAQNVRGFDEQQQEQQQQQQQHYFQQQEPRRHSSTTGTVVYDAGSEMNLPIRAIEGIPPDAAMSEWNSMDRYNNHNPNSSFISSFIDGPVSTTHRRQSDSASVYSSSSTIKPGSNSSRRPPSSRHSQSARSVVTISDIGSYHSRRGRDEGSGSVSGSVYSGMHSARNVPLPMSTTSSRRHSHAPSNHTRTHSRTPSRHSRRSDRDRDYNDHNDHAYAQTVLSGTQSIKSYRTSNTITNASQSARAVPLPDDGSTIYFDDVDFDPPEQESRSHHTSGGKSKSSKSKHRSSSAAGGSRTSRRSSRFDEPVVPADSVSQVSTNVSRRSGRSRR